MIRGLKSNFRLMVLLLIVAVVSSCTKTEYVEVPVTPDAPEEKVPTYTIMLYGTGGGNLDESFDYDMQQLALVGKQERVNFRALFKYSKNKQMNENCEGTRLLTLTKEEGLKNEKKYEASYRMDNPAHLSDFIKETQELMPADKYILIFWNHGSGFDENDKLIQDSYPETVEGKSQSRAIMSDDNVANNPYMSIFEIEKGIKDSGLKMDLVYMDACNQGMIENYAQLKDQTHYMMCSFHVAPAMGGNYALLPLALQNADSLEDAIKQYVPGCIKGWKDSGVKERDLECYDITYMDEFLGYVKNCLDRYAQLRLNKKGSESVKLSERYNEEVSLDEGGYTYLAKMVGASTSADLCFSLSHSPEISNDGMLFGYVAQMNYCLDKLTLVQASVGLPSIVDRVSMGINWPTIRQGKKLKSYDLLDIYQKSCFDQVTGWSGYLAHYTEDFVDTYQSPFFCVDNSLNTSKQTKSYLVRVNYASSSYQYQVHWYFDEADLTDDDREEAHRLTEQMDEVYEGLLSKVFYPLAFASSFEADLSLVAEECPLFRSFTKYASEIHVKITVLDSNGKYASDPDRDKCPLERTCMIDSSMFI